MAGTIPVEGDLSMESLAATLKREEDLGFEQLTGLEMDNAAKRNRATFINQPVGAAKLGGLAIVAKDAASAGTKVFSLTAYINSVATAIDIYRLP